VRDDCPSDAVLASLACGGDVEALAGLLERHRASLHAAAVALLRNRDDALEAVQETSLIALARLPSLRDPAAVSGWLHTVLRNICLMRLRRRGRETATESIDMPAVAPRPDDIVEQHALRDWVWAALDELTADDRVTVMLRHFTRCTSYQAIAALTGVPVGTVRSRLHRARSQLAGALRRTMAGSPLGHAELERTRRAEWEHFYVDLHNAPMPCTYRHAFATDVEVTDTVGRWRGIEDWSAHEREAIVLGVRARIVGLVASRDVTILEIDFANPDWASDHCPPRSTFVHHLEGGRSRRVDIHYV
jgi:RNA polymerase sigma factor (sigma-70 family)